MLLALLLEHNLNTDTHWHAVGSRIIMHLIVLVHTPEQSIEQRFCVGVVCIIIVLCGAVCKLWGLRRIVY